MILGPEILAQLPAGRLPDALVLGVGTGGTLIGVGQAFRAVNPSVRLFAMEPSESQTILCGEIASHAIEGISDGFIPGIFQRHSALIDEQISVSSEEALVEMKRLAREHGLPAYVIFHDATLATMAQQQPRTMADLQGISGMGAKKLQAYGAEVLRICS